MLKIGEKKLCQNVMKTSKSLLYYIWPRKARSYFWLQRSPFLLWVYMCLTVYLTITTKHQTKFGINVLGSERRIYTTFVFPPFQNCGHFVGIFKVTDIERNLLFKKLFVICTELHKEIFSLWGNVQTLKWVYNNNSFTANNLATY